MNTITIGNVIASSTPTTRDWVAITHTTPIGTAAASASCGTARA